MDFKDSYKKSKCFLKSNLNLLYTGLKEVRKELFVLFVLWVFITLTLGFILQLVENNNPVSVFDKWYAPYLWVAMNYVSDSDIFSLSEQVTSAIRVVTCVIAVIKVCIYTVPTGLIASGFNSALKKEKRNKELEVYRQKLARSFGMTTNKSLEDYLANLRQNKDEWYYGCKFRFIHQNIAASRFLRDGMTMKDLCETCEKYPEFRIVNESSAKSIEDNRQDRFLIEHFPVNKPYGFMVDRGSKVTIVSTSSNSEICAGNFSYYLAKFAGFNYISKDFDAADQESYYTNYWAETFEETFYEGITLNERRATGQVDKETINCYKKKFDQRNMFLNDLKTLIRDDSWVICFLGHLKNQDNNFDLHINQLDEDGKNSTIMNLHKHTFDRLCKDLANRLKKEVNLVVAETNRYPLKLRKKEDNKVYRNLLYRLQEEKTFSGFTIRMAKDFMEFDTHKRKALFIIAQTIHDVIEPSHRLKPSEVEDMNRTSRFYGYTDQEIDNWRDKIIANHYFV